ncbi:MAG: hypothetical protein ACI8SJ_001668, partial [Shewanella sp.]
MRQPAEIKPQQNHIKQQHIKIYQHFTIAALNNLKINVIG